MYVICRMCGGPGTTGDGPSAPCRGCIQAAVKAVGDLGPARTEVERHLVLSSLHTGSVAESIGVQESVRVPAIHRHAIWSPLPSGGQGEPVGMTIVERTLVRLALNLPERASNVGIMGALPVLALEVVIRLGARSTIRRFTGGGNRVMVPKGR